jgi:suppressor of G2 allele of SKP1
LKKYNECLKDAEKAEALSENDFRAFLKKGIAKYNLKKYQDALLDLEKGQQMCKNESEAKNKIFSDWISKCEKELPVKVIEAAVAESVVPVVPAPVKHDWYQTESHVTITVLAKNTSSGKVKINCTENQLTIESLNPEELKVNFNFHLPHATLPEQAQIKYLPSKSEIKLKKCEAIQWKALENDPNKVTEDKPVYPSSSKKVKDWDKISADIATAEKDEKLEGDAALNQLFQQVYANGSEETRRAMNKSFVESGGTVLSTNWSDVGKEKLEVKPPDGMEWKTWDK